MKRSLLSSLIAFLIMLIIMRVQGAPIAARVPGGILGLEFAWYDLVFEGKLLFIEHRIVILNIWLDFLFILAYTCFLVTACKAVGDRSGKTGAARFFARVVLLAGVFDVVENVAMLGRLYFWVRPRRAAGGLHLCRSEILGPGPCFTISPLCAPVRPRRSPPYLKARAYIWAVKNFRSPQRPKKNMLLAGRTAILQALDEGRPLDRIFLQKNAPPQLQGEMRKASEKFGVPINYVPVEKLNGYNLGDHGGCVALISRVQYQDLQEVISWVVDKGETPLFIILDGVTDIRNIGGIARTAWSMGVQALIIPDKASAR
jgi:hypothetical protein